MTSRLVHTIFYRADVKNTLLWPNLSVLDNWVNPNSFYDADTQFTSPGFTVNEAP